MDDREDHLTFPDVELLEDSGYTVVCRIEGKPVTLPVVFILPGSTVWRRGDRGTLVIPRRVAGDLGLI